jgi:hypothetical protein
MTCCRLLWRTLGLVMLNPVFPGDCNMTKIIKLRRWVKYTAYYYCWSATVSAIASANNLKLMWEELNNITPTSSTPHKIQMTSQKPLSSHTCRESCKSEDLETTALMSPWGTHPKSSKLLHPVKNIKNVTGEKNGRSVVLEPYLYCIPTRMLQLQLLSKAVHEHLLLLCTDEFGTKSSIADLQAAMSTEDSP